MADFVLNTGTGSLGTPQFFDIALGPTGDLQLAAGPDAIALAINQRLRAFYDDFFLDLDNGLPYLEQFSQRAGLTASFEAAMQNTVLTTPGALALLSWSATLDTVGRVLSVTFEVQVDGGIVSFSTPISVAGGS